MFPCIDRACGALVTPCAREAQGPFLLAAQVRLPSPFFSPAVTPGAPLFAGNSGVLEDVGQGRRDHLQCI